MERQELLKTLTIFNVYAPMESQEQGGRMKQVCIDNGLPIWKSNLAFMFNKNFENIFVIWENEFAIFYRLSPSVSPESKTQVTEPEFLQLLK